MQSIHHHQTHAHATECDQYATNKTTTDDKSRERERNYKIVAIIITIEKGTQYSVAESFYSPVLAANWPMYKSDRPIDLPGEELALTGDMNLFLFNKRLLIDNKVRPITTKTIPEHFLQY